MTLDEWITNCDTGISSKTMWAALKGIKVDPTDSRFGYPHDGRDFGRCYELVKECKITNQQLNKIKDTFKWLAPIIDNWQELCNIYEQEGPLYERLSELRPEISALKNESVVSPGNGISISF